MSESREFDVVIYGASGFTGRLVVEYMVAQDGLGLRWAMASWKMAASRTRQAPSNRSVSLPDP